MSATAAGHPAFWSLGPSLTSILHRSQSIGMARPYLTFTSPSTTAPKLYLRTTSQETCCTTQLTSWLVHKLTQDANHVDNHSSQIQIKRAHINLVFALPFSPMIVPMCGWKHENQQKRKKGNWQSFSCLLVGLSLFFIFQNFLDKRFHRILFELDT